MLGSSRDDDFGHGDVKMAKTKTLLRRWIAGSSDDIADELRRRTGYRLRTTSSRLNSARNAKNRLKDETGYFIGAEEKDCLEVNVRKWVKHADRDAARDVCKETGYAMRSEDNKEYGSISEMVRRAVLSGRSRDLSKRTGYVLRRTNATIAECVRRYVAGDEYAAKEISNRTGYTCSRNEKDTNLFDCVRQYTAGKHAMDKHISRRTGYVLSRRKRSLLNCVRRYTQGASEREDIVELSGYVLPNKKTTTSRTKNGQVIELVRRAVRNNRSVFVDEIAKKTGYRMHKFSLASSSTQGEDLKSFWGVVKSNASPRTVAKAATVASMALQSNTISSST